MRSGYQLLALIFLIGSLCVMGCGGMKKLDNPPAEGFNLTGSDAQAIELADEVMQAMGGRKAWDETRYLVWNFFGARKLYWDKLTGAVRVDSEKDNYTVLVNVHDGKGQVKKDGEILTQPDSLSKYLGMAKSVWINDAYWLVMPFKLKDSGVTLKHLGTQNTEAGQAAEVLELTFDGVGDTPQNKYLVFVDPATKLVNQWTFYTNATDEKPRFSTPWEGYKTHGKILLSGGRGDYKLTEIAVYDQLPASVFNDLNPVSL